MTITGRELTVGLIAPPVGAAVAGAAVRALRGANSVYDRITWDTEKGETSG